MIRRPPSSTRTDTLCPYTTLFRSWRSGALGRRRLDSSQQTRLGPLDVAPVRSMGTLHVAGGECVDHLAVLAVRYREAAALHQDRKSAGSGKRVSVRVDLGGRRILQTKKPQYTSNTNH